MRWARRTRGALIVPAHHEVIRKWANTSKMERLFEPSSLPYQMSSEPWHCITHRSTEHGSSYGVPIIFGFRAFITIALPRCSRTTTDIKLVNILKDMNTPEPTIQTTSHSHRGTPSSRPTSFKHSLASSRASSDKRLPSPFPYTWRSLRWVCTFAGSLPACRPGATRRSAEIHAFGAFRGMDAISQSNA
jgi:hypothetical protein